MNPYSDRAVHATRNPTEQMKTISFQPLIAATSLAGFWERWRTWRCYEVTLALVLLAAAPTQVPATEDIKKDVVGPWEIEATFKNDKFDHCAISRNVDKVLVKFIRNGEGLAPVLESPNWKLDRGKSYPVHKKAGMTTWNTNVAAESNSVSVPVADAIFKSGIRAANALLVEGAGSTIRVPLNESVAALNRLGE